MGRSGAEGGGQTKLLRFSQVPRFLKILGTGSWWQEIYRHIYLLAGGVLNVRHVAAAPRPRKCLHLT